MPRAALPHSLPRCLPSTAAVAGTAALAGLAGLLLAIGWAVPSVGWFCGGLLAAGLVAALLDLIASERAWRQAPITARRQLPHALALGVPHELVLALDNAGPIRWQMQVHEHLDPAWDHAGWPQALQLQARQRGELRCSVTPRQRGRAQLAPVALRLRSRFGLLELSKRIGPTQSVPVYPNFAAVSRYAWLAGDRRLNEIGIKTASRRGEGTDFKQLADYQPGDEVRRVDWKASLRHGRPIVREFQDERDQSVLFLLDCGRRMRADEGELHADGSHFDQALNALMLLAYVALKSGDAVGAMSFGTAPEQARRFAPRKGLATLDALVACLHDVQPATTQPDFQAAARDVMLALRRRSLIVVLTNFRGEDAGELAPALRMLRTRHLVLLASLRERALGELQDQPLLRSADVLTTAGAHWFEQDRRDAFQRLAARDGLLLDVEPQRLAAELVSRYVQIKRSNKL